ncbi:MAG: tRNA-uridine aminocarboxypropyltransferase [Polyangiaceae bacterium]
MAESSRGRPFCYRCHKPQVTCICDILVEPVANRTGVWLVQHPRERFHPIGTARIARLGLRRFDLTVAHGVSTPRPDDLPADAALLYPGAEVPTLEGLPLDERPSTLVVIDGTWHHARSLLRDNRWLQALPRFRLPRGAESRYRLRREPAPHCLSTIEAIVRALLAIEPETPGLGGLLDAFEAMIDRQLAIIATKRTGKRGRVQPRTQGGLPFEVAEAGDRLVVVAGEAAPRGSVPDAPHRVLQWCAVRAASGERFDRIVRPPAERWPSDCHLEHMGLSAALLREGGSEAEVAGAWRAFLRDDDVVVSWTKGAFTLLDAALAPPAHRLLLKSAYCSHHKGPSGRLDDLLARRGIEPGGHDLRGRAGRQVAQTLALLLDLARSRRLDLAEGRGSRPMLFGLGPGEILVILITSRLGGGAGRDPQGHPRRQKTPGGPPEAQPGVAPFGARQAGRRAQASLEEEAPQGLEAPRGGRVRRAARGPLTP